MAIGETVYVNNVREQLLAGRTRLSEVVGENQSERLLALLDEVDSALHRIDHGTYGVCEICEGTVEEERLRENPLARVCLDCLTPKQQRALEYDLELAAQIQKGLLPPCDVAFPGGTFPITTSPPAWSAATTATSSPATTASSTSSWPMFPAKAWPLRCCPRTCAPSSVR